MKPNLFKLENWVVDPSRRTLKCGKDVVNLQPRQMAVLVSLAKVWPEFRGREQLVDEVWGVQHISDQALNNAVSKLRQSLGDDPRSPRFIVTERTKGYALLVRPDWIEKESFKPVSMKVSIWFGLAFMFLTLLIAGTWLSGTYRNHPLADVVENPENWDIEYSEP